MKMDENKWRNNTTANASLKKDDFSIPVCRDVNNSIFLTMDTPKLV
jgi:hypothetical protein